MLSRQLPVSEEMIADYCRRNRIQSLSLFGSVLRPDFRPDSDVDVLVEFHPGTGVGMLALGRMQRELGQLLGRPVDLVPKAGLKPLVRESVLASAESVYAA